MAEERREGSPAPTAGQGMDLGSLLGGLLQGGGGQAGALGEGLGAVLRDPEAMAKLPAMIEMLRPMMGEMAASPPSHEADSAPKEESQPVAAMPKHEPPSHSPSGKKDGGGRGGCHERRIALLCALRPYLNPRRQEAIDYILRMDRMGKLFRQG